MSEGPGQTILHLLLY